MRSLDRKNEELRPVKLTRSYLRHPEGSVLIEMIIDDWSIPAVCWIWPEIPHAM